MDTNSTTNVVASAFDTIGDRLKALGADVARVVEHPFCPPELRPVLPGLLDVIEDLRQEVAELRKPCPCSEPAAAEAAAPVVVEPTEVTLTGDGLAAYRAFLATKTA
jgi:hypothetical protein